VFLVLNSFELSATIDDAERVILSVAAGSTSRDEFTAWIRTALVPYAAP
jgi:prophage maintenance system killer protein